MKEEFAGSLSTNCGSTHASLVFDGERAELTLRAKWMGDDAPLDVLFLCSHRTFASASHYGTLVLREAKDCASGSPAPLPLPPAPDDLVFEYVRVPLQTTPDGEEFTMVLWLHRESFFDDGTDLDASEYEVPPEQFRPAARALQYFTEPWKLG